MRFLLALLAAAAARNPSGFGNNLEQPTLGAGNTSMAYLQAPRTPSQPASPSPANISATLFDQRPSPRGDLSLAAVGLAQFVALDLARPADNESAPLTPDGLRPSQRAADGLPLSLCSQFLDASPIYGCSAADEARVRDGAGLAEPASAAEGPWADAAVPDSPLLASVAWLLIREHNRRAALGADFAAAREGTIAVLQQVVVAELLPALAGGAELPYSGYDAAVDPRADVFFATAAAQWTLSAETATVPRLTPEFAEHDNGPLLLMSNFDDGTGVDAVLRGMAVTRAGALDTVAEASGAAAAAAAVARGRDHELAPFATAQALLSTPTAAAAVQLNQTYASAQAVEALPGLLAEPGHATLAASLREQLNRTMHGDRLWAPDPAASFAALLANNTDSELSVADPLHAEATGGVGDADCSAGDSATFSVSMSDEYTLTWTVRGGQYLDVEIAVSGAEWCGLGFGQGMVDADLYVGSTAAGSVMDAYTTNYYPLPDGGGGGADDLVSSYVIEGSPLRVGFTRLLVASDDRDKPVTYGYTNVMWAWGTGVPSYHGVNKGKARVDFFSGSAEAIGVSDVLLLHGLVMGTCWLLIGPTGVFIARYFKHKEQWLTMHQAAQKLGASGALPMAFVAITARQSSERIPHGMVGVAVVVGIFIQSGLGIANHWMLLDKVYGKTKARLYLGRAHILLGYPLLWTGVVNCYLGAHLLFDEKHHDSVRLFFALWVGGWFLLCAVTEYRKRQRDKALQYQAKSASPVADLTVAHSRLQAFTWDQIRERTVAGANLVVVDGLVLNVSAWMASHPGGQQVLSDALGTDVSRIFRGRGVDQGMAHVHSSAAWTQLRSLAMGRVVDEKTGQPIAVRFGDDEDDSDDEEETAYAMYVVKGRERLTAEGARVPVDLFTLRPVFPVRHPPESLPGCVHLWFSAPADGNRVERPFTPVRAHSASRVQVGLRPETELQFAIKVYPDGVLGSQLNGVRQGSTVALRGPAQRSQRLAARVTALREARAGARYGITCIVGGSGLTPALHLFQWIADNGLWGKVPAASLVFAASTEADVFLRDVIERLQESSFGRLQVHFALSSVDGRLTADGLRDKAARAATLPAGLAPVPAPAGAPGAGGTPGTPVRRLKAQQTWRRVAGRPIAKPPTKSAWAKLDSASSTAKAASRWQAASSKVAAAGASVSERGAPESPAKRRRHALNIGGGAKNAPVEFAVVCGPPAFNEAMRVALVEELGYAPDDVVLL